MDLDVFNNIINNLKENNFVQDFIRELSNHLENINEKGDEKLKEQEQNKELNSYREENCLYQVVDFSTNGVFLQNTKNNKVFEETKIPQEIIDKIGNDYILRYTNGNYIIEKEITEDFFNSMIGIKEYQKIKEDFKKESNILEIDPNTHFNIQSREKDYTILKYEGKNTIKVPNALIPYFTNEKTVLYYKNGKFEKVI